MRLRRRAGTGDASGSAEPPAFRPTASELAWWADARRPFRRRSMGISAALLSALVVTPLAVNGTAGLVAGSWMIGVPFYAAFVAGASWLSWLLEERWLRPRLIVGRRIRDELLRGADQD